jgi:hypothetical protein
MIRSPRCPRPVTDRDIKRSKCPYKVSSRALQLAWVEGTRAFNRAGTEDGIRNPNPYPNAPDMHRVWREGMFAARSRRLAARGFPGR